MDSGGTATHPVVPVSTDGVGRVRIGGDGGEADGQDREDSGESLDHLVPLPVAGFPGWDSLLIPQLYTNRIGTASRESRGFYANSGFIDSPRLSTRARDDTT